MQVFRGKNVMCIGTQMSATSNRANSTSTHISATFWPVQIGVKKVAVYSNITSSIDMFNL